MWGEKGWNKSCWKCFKLIVIFFFILSKSENEGGCAFFYIIRKIGQNKGFLPCWAIPALFFKFHKNKTNWDSNMNHFRQPLYHTFPPYMNFHFCADSAYFILQVTSQSAKFLQFFLQIIISIIRYGHSLPIRQSLLDLILNYIYCISVWAALGPEPLPS